MAGNTEGKGLQASGVTSEVPSERYDIRILQSLRRIIHAVDVQSRRVAANYGVTIPQILCLLKVVENGPLTTNALSKEIFLASSTVIGILDRLEEKGYVVRTRDTKDRRQVFVNSTAEGQELVKNTSSLIHETLCNAFTDLSDLELSIIALSLEKIIELMEAEKIKAPTILVSEQLSSQ
ncbi:MAG TPA: MarR family transcriptional regulator [archaeon]|nr:MarR family transcriptional regulator [archaeon]